MPRVVAPTLLIVGGLDRDVLKMNRDAMAQMRSEVVLEIVPGATHLFEEPGTLEQVATMAAGWFRRHFAVHSDHSFGGRAVDERDLAGRR